MRALLDLVARLLGRGRRRLHRSHPPLTWISRGDDRGRTS